MSQAASASFQRTAIDTGGGGTKQKTDQDSDLGGTSKMSWVEHRGDEFKHVLQCRFKILVRFTPEGPFPGPTQHEDDAFLQLFTWSAFWYRNFKKKS